MADSGVYRNVILSASSVCFRGSWIFSYDFDSLQRQMVSEI